MRLSSVARAASARSTASIGICSLSSASGSSVAASAWASGSSLTATWLVRPARMRHGGRPATSPSEDAPPVDAEDVRQDAAQPQAVVVEGLVDPVAGPAALGNERPAVAGQLAQLAESTVAGRSSVTQDRTGRCGPATGCRWHRSSSLTDLLDVLGIEQVGVNAGVFERLERGLPVDPGAFHRGGGDAVRPEPVGRSPADRRAAH